VAVKVETPQETFASLEEEVFSGLALLSEPEAVQSVLGVWQSVSEGQIESLWHR
jgi:hypothetical protein